MRPQRCSRSRARPHRRRGIALVIALLIIVLVGGLIVGAFASSFGEYRIGRNMLQQENALSTAEYGLNDVVRSWSPAAMRAMAIGETSKSAFTVPGGGTDSVVITRLNANSYWVVSTGRTGSSLQNMARRRLNLIVRMQTAQISVLGAITSRLTSKMTLSGSANTSGIDSTPRGWTCDPPGGSVAGFAAPDTTSTNYVNSSSVANTGTPPILETPQASDTAMYSQFAGIPYDSLTAHANLVYSAGSNASTIAPSLSALNCNTSDNRNWGEPERPPTIGVLPPCYSYYPIIWAKGNFQFSSGRGQGILLVDGDFTASGGTEFKGLIITKGSFVTSGGGIKLQGALLSKGSAAQNVMSGSTQIQYSSCALQTVISNTSLFSAYVRPVTQRAWADGY